MKTYAFEHFWFKNRDDNTFAMGITEYAHSELGTLTYIDLPKAGKIIAPAETFGYLESAKSVAELFVLIPTKVIKIYDGLPEDYDHTQPLIILEGNYPAPMNEAQYNAWLKAGCPCE